MTLQHILTELYEADASLITARVRSLHVIPAGYQPADAEVAGKLSREGYRKVKTHSYTIYVLEA